tara:strand:+ start:150 stop:440 length:291 start_codon:yes stop_codon:yes gene_type:complete
MGNKYGKPVPHYTEEEKERNEKVKKLIKKIKDTKMELRCVFILIRDQSNDVLIELKRELSSISLSESSERRFMRLSGSMKLVSDLLGGFGGNPQQV